MLRRPTDFFRRCWLGLIWLATVLPASAYVTLKDSSGIYVVVWNPGPVTLQIKLPVIPSSTLLDGSTSYSTPVLAAMQMWNNVTGVVQLNGHVGTAGSYANGNGVNEIVMDSKADGEAFSANTLAITLSYRSGNVRTESDIVFNTAYTWDSYRGALRTGREDIQRVVLHELGHVLGLDHPDEATPPQTVNAIMNSHEGAIETLQTDDINGVQSLYGAPGFVPANDNFASAGVLTLSGGAAEATGSNIAATAQAGEPQHDGETPTHSVWWRWSAVSSTPVTLTTYGSNFDTVMAVYTGASVNALTQVASNDDEDRGVIRTSKLSFTPTAGTTYYIAVDGWDGSFGQIALSLSTGDTSTSPPAITTQPSNQTVTLGGNVLFKVTANNSPSAYQWYFNGNPISGGTGTTLALNNVVATNAGSYYAVASNSAGSVTSSTVNLAVTTGAATSQVVTTGHNVTLVAPTADGQYQWQISTNSGASWTDLTNNSTYGGVQTSTLTITSAGATLNGAQYRYSIDTAGGTATSAGIALNVAAALIPFPVGIAVDGSGNLYVTDNSTHIVQKISTANAVTTFAGTSGQTGTADGTGTAARFNQPSGISSAANGTLTVSDTANATIRRVASGGVVTTLAGSTTVRGSTDGAGTMATFAMPMGLAQNAAGTFYIADATNHTIRALSPANAVSTFAGTAGSAGSTDGTGSAARFNYPTGIAVDGSGNVYVADTTNNLIRKITPDGAVSTLAGVVGVSGATDGTGSAALFNQPQGLAVDGSGNLYVADTGNSVIRKITPDGSVTTLAGLSTIGGLKDGTGTDAWFNQPRALTVDGSGTVYVADTGNAAIRKITGAGVVTTLALTAGTTTSTGGGTSSGSGSSGGGSTTPSSGGSSSGGGGGGGAPSWWFLGAAGLLAGLRWLRRRR